MMNSEIALDYRFAVKSPKDAHHSRVLSDLMESSPNPMRFECLQDGAPYSGHLQLRAFGGIGLMECKLDSPVGSNVLFLAERGSEHIARNQSSEFIVSIWLGGESKLNTIGREHTGQAGDFTVTSTDNPFSVHVPNRGHACNLSLPASWDRIGDTRLESIFGSLISGSDRRRHGLVDYARHLLSRPNALTLPGAVEKLYDVIALALNTRAKSEHQTGFLALIRNYIEIHYAEPDLSPVKVAVSFDISVRYLHQLFACSDTTFTEYLIEQRLTHARHMLADPRCQHQTILSIAFDCGFRNINHFGLRYRTRNGFTPGEWRRAQVAK
jgi:AraC-like DNA-binding protein